MSWRWSRLSILAFVAVLYASPLSSGDKGLWLSVAAIPVPLFGTLPGGTPPEHAILLPVRSERARAQACVERSEPAVGVGLVAVDTMLLDLTITASVDPSTRRTLGAIRPAASASRGPPA